MKPPFQVVWFKRDLRLTDHAAIQYASEQELPTIFLYIHEPSVFSSVHYSSRHERFIWESIKELIEAFKCKKLTFFAVEAEALPVFEFLVTMGLERVISIEEIGLEITFKRDRELAVFFKSKEIDWKQLPYSGIRRALPNRKDFNEYWYRYMSEAIPLISWENFRTPEPFFEDALFEVAPKMLPKKPVEGITQKGGSQLAWQYLKSFTHTRAKDYMKHISKPDFARKSCSRLSPYLAWGNISLREVIQWQARAYETSPFKRNLRQFASRLRWREHFMQKFESECEMEYVSVNRGYESVSYEQDDAAYEAWKKGATGFPLVDACMRSLIQTGYLNFRMRAMLVSFLTHHMNQRWDRAANYLSGLFLDFEPGIHFPQIQMQAGITGINTVRIYNPTKQAEDQDPNGMFIKQWCPELVKIPVPLLFEPWKLTPLEQQMHDFQLGVDYPFPILDLKETHRMARERLYGIKKTQKVKKEAVRIVQKHTLAVRKP